MNVLRNRTGDYPWQTVRWDYGVAFFVLPPAAVGFKSSIGAGVLGAVFGTVFVIFTAVLAWWIGV